MHKNKKTSKLKKLYDDIGIIDTHLIKAINKKTKKYNKVKDNIPLVEDYNFQADLLFLPTTKEGYKYILGVVDLASDEFDIEPIKNKKPTTIINAFKAMVERKYINYPYASIRTDAGTEFKGEFSKFLIDKAIIHKVSLVGRHRATANIERLNRELVKLFIGYMNSKESSTGKEYKEWTDVVELIRTELNKIRKIKLPKTKPYNIIPFNPKAKPKFKIGDMVHRMLDTPKNALNESQSGNFREGDYRYNPVPEMIEQILYFSGDVNYRYILKHLKGVSFAEYELIKATNVEDEVLEINKILGRHYDRKEKTYYYHLQMYGETKQNAGYYDRKTLVRDIGLHAVEELDNIYKDLNK